MNSEYSAQVIAFPANAVRKLHARHHGDQQNRQEKDRTLTGDAFFSALRANVDKAEKILEKSSVLQEEKESEDQLSRAQICTDVFSLATEHDLHFTRFGSTDGIATRSSSDNLENADIELQSSGRIMKLNGNLHGEYMTGRSSLDFYGIALAEKKVSSSFEASEVVVASSFSASEKAIDEPPQPVVKGDDSRQNTLAGMLLHKQDGDASPDISVDTSVQRPSEQERRRQEAVPESSVNKAAKSSKSDGAIEELRQTQSATIPNQSIDASSIAVLSGARTSTDQIVENIRAAQTNNPPAGVVNLSSGNRVVRISLQPESLGSVEVSLTMRGSELAIRITVDRLETRREISRSKETLLEALSEAGLSVNGVEIVDVSPAIEPAAELPSEVKTGSGDGKAHFQFGNQFSEQKYRQRRLNDEQAVENRSEGSNYEGDDVQSRPLGGKRMGYFL